MRRSFRLNVRLLLSFFIIVFFTLMVGVIGFVSLRSIGDSAVKVVNNVRILNDVFDHCVAVDAGISTMLYASDIEFNHYVVQKTKEHTGTMVEEMDKYLAIQEQFNDIFTPGEMQDIYNVFEVYNEIYIPVANEIFDLVEQARREEALYISVNRLTPTYNTIMYTINAAFLKNLEYSEILTFRNSKDASLNAFSMLAVGFLSLIVSVVLAFATTKSIHEKEKAETLARTKSDFLAKMSHEIRTPMNAITGMAELALREDMPDTAREHILTIKQAGGNLLSIINDILDFSKIESGKMEIVPVKYLFSSLINDVISIIRTKVIDSNLLFVANIDSNIPNALIGDEVRVRQALLNILSNAVKYTEKGFVSLTVTGKIQDGIIDLVIAVADSGKGIKPDDIKNLFGDFVQFDMASNKGIEGTGLGLAITKNIIKAMDGDILVDSEYGKGSTFTITLPQKIHNAEKLAFVENPGDKSVLLYEQHKIYANSILYTLNNLGVDCTVVSKESEFCEKIKSRPWPFIFVSFDMAENAAKIIAQFEPRYQPRRAQVVVLAKFGEVIAGKDVSILSMPAHSITVANTLNGTASGSVFDPDKEFAIRFVAPGAKVLVVDDINTNLKVAEGLLLPYKMQVELCSSGFKAIEAVKAARYDLIFMDHMMPEMDGIEATAAIRSLEGGHFKTLPIVALTANAISGMREMFINNGFNDFLAKPIDTSKLDEILNRWIPEEKREKRKVKNDKDGANASVSAVNALFAVPGLDAQRGIAMTGGTMEMYSKVLTHFYKDVQERLPLLQAVPSAESLLLFVTCVHAIKSASASVGAAEVSALAAKLEAAGKAGDMAFIGENLSCFAEQLAELARGIGKALELPALQQGEKPGSETPGSLSALPADLLQKLQAALESQKVLDIYRLLDELNQKAPNPKTAETLQRIYDHALMSEFDSAIKVIREGL